MLKPVAPILHSMVSPIVQANVLTRSIVRDYQSLRPTTISARRIAVVYCSAAARPLSLVQPPVTGPATSTSSLRVDRCPVDITTLSLQNLGASGGFVSSHRSTEAAYPRREWLVMQAINLAAILLRSCGPTSQLRPRLRALVTRLFGRMIDCKRRYLRSVSPNQSIAYSSRHRQQSVCLIPMSWLR